MGRNRDSTKLSAYREALKSPRQQDRVLAMQHLREWAKKTPAIRADVLPLFQHAIDHEPDRWTLIHAAYGILAAAGPEAARTAWLTLLARDDVQTVAAVVSAITDPSYIADFHELLRRRPEMLLRHAVIRSFGRMRDASTFDFIVDAIGVPELRPDVVQALEDLGDPRAIPFLETLLDDTADAWETDNQVATLSVGNVASTAIARLRVGRDARRHR